MIVALDAPAKVNLVLRVGPPEPDGYHPLGTVFCALELADTVELAWDHPHGPGLDVAFEPPLSGLPDLGDPDSNLATRAVRAFVERAPAAATPRVRLIKRIPSGGGLGGGSSDAAAVLRGLDRAVPGAVDPRSLAEVAAGLGADVPFFLLGAPFARATGRGERLDPLPPLPSRPVVLVLPDFGVATPEAYRWLDEDRGDGGVPVPTAPTPTTWAEVSRLAANDLEHPVFARHPELRAIRDRLRDLGAEPALMAGSGSSVFGVFSTDDAAGRAVDTLAGMPSVGAVVLTATRP